MNCQRRESIAGSLLFLPLNIVRRRELLTNFKKGDPYGNQERSK